MARSDPNEATDPLARAPRQALGHDPIPADRYLSPEFARLEWEGMWRRVWLFAGLASDLAEPGDHLTFEIGPESVLLVRQDGGDIRAYYNVCMHRGARLREPGRGRTRHFVCRYHAWRYGLDGRLEHALDVETFPQGCPARTLSLRPVRCEISAGLVFVCFDPDARPLDEYLGEVAAHLAPYHLEEMSVVDDWALDVACNWKTSVDAFNEAYHICGTHPETLPVNDDVHVPIDCYERHSRMILRLAVSSPRLGPRQEVHREILESFVRSAGIDPDTFEGGPEDVRPALVRAIREVQGPALGADFSELCDEQLVDDFHYTVFPNLTLNLFGRSAWLFRHRPDPEDPQRMVFDFLHLVRAPRAGLARARQVREVAHDDLEIEILGGGGELLAQDLRNLPRIQAGMRSQAFRQLHLGEQERRIRHFHRVLEGTLGIDHGAVG